MVLGAGGPASGSYVFHGGTASVPIPRCLGLSVSDLCSASQWTFPQMTKALHGNKENPKSFLFCRASLSHVRATGLI